MNSAFLPSVSCGQDVIIGGKATKIWINAKPQDAYLALAVKKYC